MLTWKSFARTVLTVAALTMPGIRPAAADNEQSAPLPALVPAAAPAPAPADDDKGPPLPFHTIEGIGGGAITPMAYLVNPGPEQCLWGKPAFSMSYVNLGAKNLDALVVSETLFGRIEFSYAADRLGLGTLPDDVRIFTGGLDIGRSDVWLDNFNIRGLLVKEDTCLGGIAMPAITAGISFKVNEGIEEINDRLSGALDTIGYRRSNGTDFTLTTTKKFANLFFDRPLIATAGLRLSQAAELGFLGFGETYHATFEGNIAVLPWDNVLIAYEFRQKTDPYSFGLAPVIGEEDNWNAIDASWILSKHATLVAGWGHFGNLANAQANGAWWFQLKYEL